MKYAIEVPATLGRSVQVTWCCHAANLVRDEGVAGSNPATPTKKPLQNKDLSHPARTGATASGQESGQIEGAPPPCSGNRAGRCRAIGWISFAARPPPMLIAFSV